MDPFDDLFGQLSDVPLFALDLNLGIVSAILQKCLLLIIRIESLLAVLTFRLKLAEMTGVGTVEVLVLFEALIVSIHGMAVPMCCILVSHIAQVVA